MAKNRRPYMVRKARSGIEGSNREVLIAVGLELGNRAFCSCRVIVSELAVRMGILLAMAISVMAAARGV